MFDAKEMEAFSVENKWRAMNYLIKSIKHKKLIQRCPHGGNEYFPKVIC